MTDLLVSPTVSLVNGRPSVTSLQVAEHFGKTHDRVLKDIRNVIAKCPPEFHLANFDEVLRTIERPDGSKIETPMFNLTRNGFMLVVMGYTGSKAIQIKIFYIAAFDAMEAELSCRPGQPALESTATPSTPADRAPLRALVYAWSQACGIPIQAVWPQLKAHFQLTSMKDMPVEWIPDALTFAQSKIDEVVKVKAIPAPVPAPVDLREIGYVTANVLYELDAKGEVSHLSIRPVQDRTGFFA